MIQTANVGIGSALSRVEGADKVTGQARYAAEYPCEGLLHGVIVSSAIARGTITSIDDRAARAVPGVVDVLTHDNRPATAWDDDSFKDELSVPGEPFKALHGNQVQFSGQPVALVVAESFAVARHAASLVKVDYAPGEHNIDFAASLAERFLPERPRDTYTPPKGRGDPERAFAAAPLKVAGDYTLATEHHNPMEMQASTVRWEGEGRITAFDKTQGSQGVQAFLAKAYRLEPHAVRVVNHHVGGAFGSGLRPQYQLQLAVLAALHLKQSVRVVMTRQQMFTHAHRPQAWYGIRLGADASGRLQAILGDATTSTSRFEQNMENIVTWGMSHYACPNAAGSYTVAPRDTYTSADMRAPGAATGMTLFEIAMDELACAADVDPLELRLRNYADRDEMNDVPFTSKALRQAYQQGAEAFGWSRRSPAPRSMRDGRELIGWGMATGVWEALFTPHTARACLTADGRLEVSCATSDIGTGTRTVMTQVAAEVFGLPAEAVTACLGDSSLPTAPVEGGSWAAASAGAAVDLACRQLAGKLVELARGLPGQPLRGVDPTSIRIRDDKITVIGRPDIGVQLQALMTAAGIESVEVEATAKPSDDSQDKARNTHGAVFCEVRVDETLGMVRVTRLVSAIAAGRIINPKTARSQIIGGVVMGIGMALHEETLADRTLGRFMNHNLAEYHVPVQADVGDIEVLFVDEPDAEVSPLGVKGVGEIGIVGVAAAIANAIHHATGVRVRDLPITLDKLLA